MSRIHLATGIAIREGTVLLVASSYPSHEVPLWNLPGGRQQQGELFPETLAREVREETGLEAGVADLAYVSESYDGDTHILNVTFEMSVRGTLAIPKGGDHVVDAAWCAFEDLDARLSIEVVRAPLLAYLRGGRRYRGFARAGISVRWPDERGNG